MRALLIAVLAALALAGCSGDGDTPADPAATDPSAGPAEDRPVRGDIEVAVEPLVLDELPETPEAGFGRAHLDGESFDFAVDFCDAEAPIGTGEGEGVTVAWDLRMDDGDHRVAIVLVDSDERWVRAGPAEAEWDAGTRTLRFAGAFVPFRTDDGSQARRGGIVAVCPPEG